MKRIIYFCLIITSLALLVSGCSTGSNNTMTTGFPEGSGYKINLSVSQRTLPPSGTAIVSGVVIDDSGNPVDQADVILASNQGGTFSNGTDKIKIVKTTNGIFSVVYAPPQPAEDSKSILPSRLDQITASFYGAISVLEVELVSPSF